MGMELGLELQVKYWKVDENVIIENVATAWQNQQNYLCAQRRLRSAWASAQSDQSLPCPHEDTLGAKLP